MYERMMDKTSQPTDLDMITTIGNPVDSAWTALRQFLQDNYRIIPIFNSGGKKYGWNLQYRWKSRPLCEMYPEYGSFTVLVILGKAELEQALVKIDNYSPTIKMSLLESPRYHDGCWMYMRVKDQRTCLQDVQSIEQLILIKKKPPFEN